MIYIYTDGACSGNPGPGGSAFIAVENNEEIYRWSMPIPEATNNMCELIAIVEACRWTEETFFSEQITIRTDSAYCHNCYVQKWFRNWQKNGWKNSKKSQLQIGSFGSNLFLSLRMSDFLLKK